MSWDTITTDDVKERVAGPIYRAVEAAALATDQDDPWPGLIQKSVDQARGMIASNRANKLGAGETVPSAAVQHTVTLTVWYGIGRFGDEEMISKDLETSYAAANTYFNAIAKGSMAVELPDDVDETSMPVETGGFSQVNPELSPKRQATRNRLDGL